jgi:YHS domain-containing protein
LDTVWYRDTLAKKAQIEARACNARICGTVPDAVEPDALTDPVCGVWVGAASPYHHAYRGALFCFCGARCRDRFIADPSTFVVLVPARGGHGISGADPGEQIAAPIRPEATRPPVAPSLPYPPTFDLTEPIARAATLPTAQLLNFPVGPPQSGDADPARTSGTASGALGETRVREFLTLFFPWRERRFARRVSRELLKLYWIVSASHPDLKGRDLYRKIVIARTRADPEAADTLIDQAEESFATWPARRTLMFCDVVHFLAVSEFLASHGNSLWIHANMGREIAAQIPHNL